MDATHELAVLTATAAVRTLCAGESTAETHAKSLLRRRARVPGLNAFDGCLPSTPVFDQTGPHAWTVRDLLSFDDMLSGLGPARAASLRGLRLGLIRSPCFTDLDPEVERICSTGLVRHRRAGVILVQSDVPKLAPPVAATIDQVQTRDFRPTLTRYPNRLSSGLSFDDVMDQVSDKRRAVIGPGLTPGTPEYVPEEQYREIGETLLPALRGTLARCVAASRVVAIVFPTAMTIAPWLERTTCWLT